MTKYIEMSGKSKGKFFVVDDDDYEEFSKYTWYLDARGYPSTTIKAHQLAMKSFRRDGKMLVDHKDGNSLNNTKDNLRLATSQQNMQNRKLDARNKSGYKGVVRRSGNKKNPYAAFIGAGETGKSVYLGVYKTAEDAARAYDIAALEFFGEYARLNFPEEK